MQQAEIIAYAERCFGGEPASCTYACPFRLDIRTFLERVSRGKWKQAYKTFRNATVFPGVAAALCSAPCRGRCQREALGDEPLNLSAIENAVIRFAPDKRGEQYVLPAKKGSVAVVGAGLAGLAVALGLAQKKYSVTVFEKENEWGGKLRANEKFSYFEEDINNQFAFDKPEFRFNTEIKSLENLEEFDAVFVASGKNGLDFGLSRTFDKKLRNSENPRIFFGGGIVGEDAIHSLASAPDSARMLEVFLQTGKASATYGSYDKRDCGHYVEHFGVEKKPLVLPASGGEYSEAEAKAEAARCMQCDCRKCLANCEMLEKFKKLPKKIASEVYTDIGAAPPYSTHMITRETYSCLDCGYCGAVCPEGVNVGEILHLSRVQRAEDGVAPAALHDFWLREMTHAATDAGYVYAKNDKCEYLFFPGCQLGAMEPEHVIKSYEFLENNYNCGIFLGCCGAPAYWAGRMDLFGENISNIRDIWGKSGKPALVIACATCERMFKETLPEIQVISIYELMEKSKIQQLSIINYPLSIVFDPCSAREDSAMKTAVRSLAASSGIALEELENPGKCCGNGGHIRAANRKLFEEMSKNRAEESPLPYIVYCANCRDVFDERGKECLHILDILFGLKPGIAPLIGEKRRNRMEVKLKMQEKLEGFSKENPQNSIELVIEAVLAEEIDRKLIGEDEMREAIEKAEKSGVKFIDSENIIQCSLVKGSLTYWVRYKSLGNGKFEIKNAYYHRMRIAKED
ncbi:MAG: FAD-dependent oxidoreductase [Oscillospiraceae bacterium]|jgi:NADPH-dependent glutamate synthase beta subunit-like oxidoreductase|nr:FAD-dependent oxidoreductase [Oscillospiraceae bacterium]